MKFCSFKTYLLLSICIIPFFSLTAQKYYSGIWLEGDGEYKIWADVKRNAFEKKRKELNEDGYRLVDIETTFEDGERRFFGLFHQSFDRHVLRVGKTWFEFQESWDEAKEKGYRICDIEVYRDRQGRKFTAIWREGEYPEKFFFDLSWEAFKEKWDELNSDNYRLVDFEVYLWDGSLRYAGVWEGGESNDLLLHNLPWDKFDEINAKLIEGKMRLRDLEIHPVRKGEKRFSGVWYRESGQQRLLVESPWPPFLSKIRQWESSGYVLQDIETETSESVFFDPAKQPIAANVDSQGRSSRIQNTANRKPSRTPKKEVTKPKSGAEKKTKPEQANVDSNKKKTTSDKKTAASKPKTETQKKKPTASPPSNPKIESGTASYYANKFHGLKTSSGELYDKNALTCAHRTHKFGTYLKVTNIENKRVVYVRVNDRGPHVKGRIVDLSFEAANRVDAIRAGLIKVTAEVVSAAEAEQGNQ